MTAHRLQILDEHALVLGARLTKVPRRYPIGIVQAIDDGTSVLAHTGREDDDLIPITDLLHEILEIGPFADIERHGHIINVDIETVLVEVSVLWFGNFERAVQQCLIQVQDENGHR